MSEKIILGIDPGTNIMGYGLICIENKNIKFIKMDVIKLIKIEDHFTKLKIIFERTLELIDTFHPDELSIESQFFGKNVQSMLKLGRAQGVAISACLYRSIPIFEYSPKKIKQSITGNGNSSKEQVSAMLKTLLKLETVPDYFDSTDALAAAVCHYFQNNNTLGETKYNNWNSFITKNPNRVKLK